MRPLTSDIFERDPGLVVSTVRSVADGKSVMAADFRDQEAIFHIKGGWLCVDVRGEFRLGRGPLRMVEGVWMADPHPGEKALAGSLVSSELLELRPLG